MDKEQIFNAEMVHYELGQIEQELTQLDEKHQELTQLRDALGAYDTIKPGEELLVPLAHGIFMNATAGADKTLHVNVGSNVVVPRSTEHVHDMLSQQLESMEAHQKELQRVFEEKLGQLQQLERETCSDSSKTN